MRIHLRGNKVMEWMGALGGSRRERLRRADIYHFYQRVTRRDVRCPPCCQNANEMEQRKLHLLSWWPIWDGKYSEVHFYLQVVLRYSHCGWPERTRSQECRNLLEVSLHHRVCFHYQDEFLQTSTSKQKCERPINWDTLRGLISRLSPICHAAKIPLPLSTQIYFHSRGKGAAVPSLGCSYVRHFWSYILT